MHNHDVPSTNGSTNGSMTAFRIKDVLNTAVIVAALGYFVDIYDLILFSIVRVPSLTSFGLSGEQLVDKGILLINMQMFGMLVGGLFWGVLGDKRGRLAILFGSIITYSLANVANGFATSVEQYAVLRFIAGVGLAGELGAGITLVVEVMPKESRGWGTMVVAGVGLFGAIAANLTVKSFDWRTAYFIGGGLGFLLLALRFSVVESGMFDQLKAKDASVSRGNFFLVFSTRERFVKYLRCVVVGIPLWFVVGILVTFSPEIGKAMGIASGVTGGDAIMYCYAGIATGDFLTGWLSQRLQSRIKVLLYSLIATSAMIVVYFFSAQLFGAQASSIYIAAYLMGVACGYWAIFVTIAAEQFGTNVRATVTTTVPNFVRGSVPLLTFAFKSLSDAMGIVPGTALLGAIVLAVSMLSLVGMHETFGKDLDYVER
jgi:MFS transporter, putative metabolite:H+ symporter